MKPFFSVALAFAFVCSASAAFADCENKQNGKICILHAPAEDLDKAFYLLLPKKAAEAHLAHHYNDRRVCPSLCQKPGATK
jgi:hypothetical protein